MKTKRFFSVLIALLMIISSDVLIAMVQIKFMIMMMEKDFLETVNCVTKMDI